MSTPPQGRRTRASWIPGAALVAPILLLVAACSSEQMTNPTCDTDPSLCPAGPDTTAAFFANLPSWGDFAAPDTVLKNELKAEADTLPVEEVIVDSVPVFDDQGLDSMMTNVRYVCQARPFTISDAPEKITMFSPNQSLLYAGAMIQGRSKKELGSLLPLEVAERKDLTITIGDLPTGANSRTVPPTLSGVEGGRGDMIGNAVLDNLDTPTTSNFEMESYHSERSFALSASLSGRYLGFEGTASGSTERSLSETTVTAHFYQKMYTVSVERPTGGFFTDDFDNAALAGYVGQGVIGPDNLPVYISEIVYGRMMMFSVTSSASESEIRAAMQASYNTFTGGVSAEIDGKSEEVLKRSKIAITAVGGSGDAVAAMITSGDWSQYFASSVELSQAVPLTYTFSNVQDGSIAAVTEATDYNINECQPKPLIPGTFDFNARQDIAVPLTPGYTTLWGDANGDDMEDMIFTYRSGSTNEIAVAFGQMDGTFTIGAAQDATVTPAEGWSLFTKAAVGDFNGDGNDDVVFNRLDAQNSFYVALSNGDGTFTWGDRHDRTENGWSIYGVYAADLDNDDNEDLIWNGHTTGTNRTYTAMSAGDGTFDLTTGPMDQIGTVNWTDTDFLMGDVTGDGFIDLIHSRTRDDDNATWVSRSLGDGTFVMSDGAFTNYNACCWGAYEPHAGDINGDQRTDLFWIADAAADIPIHRATGNASGTFSKLPWQHVPDSADAAGPYEVRIGDVDADGDADILMVDLDSSNNNPVLTNRVRIWVGLGTVDQLGTRFDFTPVDQLHPASTTWGQFRVHVADVNGDNKSDLVLHWNASPHQVYVALAK